MNSHTSGPVLCKIGNWWERAAQAEYRAPVLASLCSVSLRTLQRFFQQKLRTSPQKWLNQVRQLEAEQLAKTGARTKEIAYRLGFRQPSHFCRQFKEHHGISPKAWRLLSDNRPRFSVQSSLKRRGPVSAGRPLGNTRMSLRDNLLELCHAEKSVEMAVGATQPIK